MSTPDSKYSQWLAKVLSKSSQSWLSPVVVLALGFGIVLAIWRKEITIAIVFVSIITLTLSTYIVYVISVGKNQLSQVASLSEVDEPEYITLESTLLWVIENESGSAARLEKTKKIQPLKPLDVVKEFWWGDGKRPLDQDYTLTPPAKEIGRRFRQGSKWVTLVVLDRIYGPDQEVELIYTRKLVDAFKSNSEWVETFVASKTARLNLSVVFPNNHIFKSARAVSSLGETSKEYPLKDVDSDHGQLLSGFTDDGRAMLTWSIDEPELGWTYTIEWDW